MYPNKVEAQIKYIKDLSEIEKIQMYTLMNTFYDNMNESIFYDDLSEKEWVLILYNQENKVVGFTTIMLINLQIEGKDVYGIFSGDTIVHKDYWNETELSKKWINFMLELENQNQYENNLYWFIICKGYKTYRFLPVFYNEFYPRYDRETPMEMKQIMNAFGEYKYPREYREETGVIHYKNIKDKLKEGVGDIDARRLKDPHIAFFKDINPGYINGEDLVCITKISYDNLNRAGKKLLK